MKSEGSRRERARGAALRGLVAVVSGAVLAAGLAVAAGAAEDYRAGVIDRQAILERTKAGKRALEELRTFSAARQKIIAAEDEELKKLENELKELETGGSEDVKRDKQERFRAKLEAYQRRIQEFNREIQAKQKNVADEFQRKVDEVAAVVAKKHGFAVLFDKGSGESIRIVLYNRPSLDVTDQVVKDLDRRYK